MRYEIRDIDEETASRLMPQAMALKLGLENVMTAVALAGEKTVGVALFCHTMEIADNVSLLYIAMQEEYRHMGYGRQLLEYVADVMAIRGAKTFECELTADRLLDDEAKKDAENFLNESAFKLRRKHGHYLVYDMEAILKGSMAGMLDKFEVLIDKVQYYNELSDEQMQDFERLTVEEEHYVPVSDLDALFARFYVKNNKILAYMDIREVMENVIYMTDSFVAKKCDEYALPAMIAAFVQISSKLMPDETRVILPIYSEASYNGIVTSFGKPKYEGEVNMYRREL